MAKEYYRNSNGLVVTDSTIQAGDGSVYQLRNINSHKIGSLPYVPERFSNYNLKRSFYIVAPMAAFIIPVVGAIFFFPLAAYCWWKAYQLWKKLPKNYYCIVLSTSSGEVQSFSSLNLNDVQDIANAITDAMSDKAA